MVLKGGVLQFISEDETIQKEALIAILDHDKTIISLIHKDNRDGIVFVFKITFDSQFQHYFRRNSLGHQVIILKFFVYTVKQINQDKPPQYGYDKDQYIREIRIAKELGAQTNSDPICPSYLYQESIEHFGRAEQDRNSLYSLLKSNLDNSDKARITLYDEIQRYTLEAFNPKYTKLTHNQEITSLSSLRGGLLFMEFFDCCTLREFCETIHYERASEAPVISINGCNLDEASNRHVPNTLFGLSKESFMTLVIHLLTLQLFELRCIHGDLHPKNVFIFVENGDIKLKIIDFGRSKYWTTKADMEAELKLDIDISDIPDIHDKSVISAIYDETTARVLVKLVELYNNVKTTEANVYTTISKHIAKQEFSEASCIIDMCKVLNEHKSPLWHYLKNPIGSPYSNMYNFILPPELVAYKTIIKRVLYTPIIEGGISFYKKTKVPILMYRKSKKSKKSKKRKNKTKNTKKSRKITMKKRINKANK
jgi:serine/threonine protein kinase